MNKLLVEKALNDLIPRHPGALPPELIELTSALVAQSRSKASTLKAQEEIARTYVCANIACERLKTKLDLPPIEPRPPIRPHAYKKLYSYINGVLPRPRGRPRKDASAPSTPSKSRDAAQKPTPSKRSTPSLANKIRTPKAGLRFANAKQREERVPKWVAPVVRKMCCEMDTRTAIPHVLAGVETILCLPSEVRLEGKNPALVAAVWFFVIQEITGRETSKKEFAERRNRILDIFTATRSGGEVVDKIGDGEEAWRGWTEVGFGDVQTWIVEVTKQGLLEMDWFVNIRSSDDNSMDVDSKEERDDWEVEPSGPTQMGMGRMMQNEYDYLSAENQENYGKWKKTMLGMIDGLIKEGVMHIDPPAS